MSICVDVSILEIIMNDLLPASPGRVSLHRDAIETLRMTALRFSAKSAMMHQPFAFEFAFLAEVVKGVDYDKGLL